MFGLMLGGHKEGNADDPFLTGASILDSVVPGPLAKDRREDMQLFSALAGLTLKGLARNPLRVEAGQDPPDRWLVHGDRRWAMELTELTVADVRQTMSPPRMIARELSTRLNRDLQRFAHLRGRVVVLSCDEDVTVPRCTDPLLEEMEKTLAVDLGYVGEGVDFSKGMPEHLPMDRGHHGQYGPFQVTVQAVSASGAVAVSASVQTLIKRSEAVAALAARVTAKDKPTNEVLLVTCGAPDPQGYVCSVDTSLFHLLYQGQRAGVQVLPSFAQLTHLRSVVLHLWNTSDSIVWGADADLPWVCPQAAS